MRRNIQTRDFLTDEAGTVVIDWVVLTSTTIGISLFMFDGVASSVERLAYDLQSALTHISIPTSFADYQAM